MRTFCLDPPAEGGKCNAERNFPRCNSSSESVAQLVPFLVSCALHRWLYVFTSARLVPAQTHQSHASCTLPGGHGRLNLIITGKSLFQNSTRRSTCTSSRLVSIQSAKAQESNTKCQIHEKNDAVIWFHCSWKSK